MFVCYYSIIYRPNHGWHRQQEDRSTRRAMRWNISWRLYIPRWSLLPLFGNWRLLPHYGWLQEQLQQILVFTRRASCHDNLPSSSFICSLIFRPRQWLYVQDCPLKIMPMCGNQLCNASNILQQLLLSILVWQITFEPLLGIVGRAMKWLASADAPKIWVVQLSLGSVSVKSVSHIRFRIQRWIHLQMGYTRP